MKAESSLTGRSRLLIILIGVMLFMSVLDDYQGWRFMLFAFGGAWWLCRHWARVLENSLRLRREMRFGWMQVGDQLEERFTLENRGSLPGLWVEIIDHSDLPGYQNSMVTGIDGHTSRQWRRRGICTHRGLYTLGPTTLRTSDPLGLFNVEIHAPGTITLMVTPPVVPLPYINVAPGGRVGEGRPYPNAPERTVSADGVRQYIPGDSLRWVHWPTTARRDDYFVRTFESTPSGDWWILLDVDQDVQVGIGQDNTLEHAIVLAASLADRGLRLGRSVGVTANADPLIWLPPREGDGQRWQILRSLALLSPAEGSLEKLLTGIRPSLGRHASLIIITPDVQGEWVQSLIPLVWQDCVPTVLLLDPVSFGGESSAHGLFEQLAYWGINRHLVSADMLDRPEAQPGKHGRMDFRITPTGRAVLVNPPGDISWRVLS